MPKAPRDFEERIDLPNGESVWYIDAHPTDPKQNHSYWRHNAATGCKGKRLTGVTTAVKTLDYDPENLLRWAARKQCEGIARLYLESDGAEFLNWLTDADQIWRELESHGLTYDQFREQKGTEGTNVHVLAFQALAMGRPVPDFSLMNEVERQKGLGVAGFWLDHEPKTLQVEQVVFSDRLGVAGRLDFRGELGARCDNHICACQDAEGPGVIDAKTGSVFTAAHAQVGGGYPLLAEESGFGESNWAAVLKVHEDGSYEFYKAEGTPDDFEKAVDAYRSAGGIRSRSSAGYKARKAAGEMQSQIDNATEVMA